MVGVSIESRFGVALHEGVGWFVHLGPSLKVGVECFVCTRQVEGASS